MRMSRRSFLLGVASMPIAAALPACASITTDPYAMRRFEPSADPETVRALTGTMLFEFDSDIFDRAMLEIRSRPSIPASYAVLTGTDDWYLRSGDTVWALSAFYQNPADGRFLSTFPVRLLYSSRSVVNMTSGVVVKSSRDLDFNAIVRQVPSSVLKLNPYLGEFPEV